MVDVRETRERVPLPGGVLAIGLVNQHRPHCRPDGLGGALFGSDNPPHTEVGAAPGVARLVALHGNHHHRDGGGEAPHDRPEAAVRHDEVAAR